MDIWGLGAVLFEIISLFPLFPGDDELDQINKIHNILGRPPLDLLNQYQSVASHMEFNFPPQIGTGFEYLIPYASKDSIHLIRALLTYDPCERITSEEAICHDYFDEIWDYENEKTLNTLQSAFSKNAQTQDNSYEQNSSIVIDGDSLLLSSMYILEIYSETDQKWIQKISSQLSIPKCQK